MSTPHDMPPDPQAAPGGLETVRLFVNTLDIEAGTDALENPDALTRWLVAKRLMKAGTTTDAAGFSKAIQVREALRSLLEAHNGKTHTAGAVRTLNRAAADAHLVVQFDPDCDCRLEVASDGLDQAVGRLLASVHQAMADGTWSRLKACQRDTCRWAFYDNSKNRSGHWCSMATCGNRAKVSRFRERQKGTAPA